MNKMVENLFYNYPDNIKYKLQTSIDLINIYRNFDENYFKDWTFIVFPIIIALEGYIKWLSIKSNIPFKKNINYFDLRDKPFKIKSNLSYDLNKFNLIKIIENCYNI
ncbi:MAG: hypothetical protein K2I49_02210, partial [Ureaplasma sp.]|nr:hypothetical protein [Ureaplasma sp.]